MKDRSVWAAAGCALGGAMAYAGLAGWPVQQGYQLIWVVLMAIVFIETRRFWQEADRRAQICFGLLGCLLLLAMGLGRRLETAEQTGLSGLGICAMLALLWGPAAGGVLLRLCRWMEQSAPGKEARVRRVFWVSFLVLFACWIPVQLAYFPCCFGYDMNGQIGQVNNSAYNSHHPLAHTLLVGAFYVAGGRLGSYTAGIWAFAIFQMLSLAAAMAYALAYLAQLRCPRWLRLALTVLFAVGPQHAVMSIGCTKDVPFAILMTLGIVELHKLWRDPQRLHSPKIWLRVVLILAGACLMRNNASMAIAAFVVFALLLMGRGHRLRMTALILSALLLSSVTNTALKHITHAQEGAINEMLSVPAQQLARIYDRYGFDVPAGYEVVEWVPHADMYDPARADFTKQHLRITRDGELFGFLKFWVREFFHYPIEYIDAFLLNAKGYWYPDDTSFATIYGQWPEAYVGAFITEQYPIRVTFTRFLPRLREAVEYLFVQNHYQRVPGLSTLIHPATYTWMLLTAMAWAIWRRRRAALAAGCMLLMYLLTLFLGPCALVRYCYYLMIGAPFLMGLMACREQA